MVSQNCGGRYVKVKTLDRNIATQYYERRLAAQREDIAVPAPRSESDPMEYIKIRWWQNLWDFDEITTVRNLN